MADVISNNCPPQFAEYPGFNSVAFTPLPNGVSSVEIAQNALEHRELPV
jgi:hypothetical protein